ncbi:hypothetical protein [Paenibacillus sp. Soil787]|uniref:hypothetical protein n=1 Tax=Paenibacillus sp. Soil787 TaxID=1736411 RepID=UPI000702A42A|nr:hypothetical protein [Paenibacillus sp. Soil787]KRF22526.1 hypothetical protein ASG93_29870 [Paenibacillus sp. Soil787]
MINGLGTFDYKNGEKKIEAEFYFDWSPKALSRRSLLQIEAVKNETNIFQENFMTLPNHSWELITKTKDNRQFIAQNLFLKSVSESEDKNGISYIFGCSSIEIGDRNEQFEYIEFYFPNVFIGFDEFEKKGSFNFLNKSNLTLEYNDTYTLTFSGLNETSIHEKKKEIISKGNDISTLKVIVQKASSNHIYFSEANKVIELVSDLMSFVYDGPVSWIHAIAYQHNEEVFNYFRDVKYPRLGTFRKLIRFEFPYILTSYISKAFTEYKSFSEEKQKAIRTFINGLHFSSERLVFPAPFTSLGSSIEDYIERSIPETESRYISKPVRKKMIDPSFELWVREHILPLLNEVDREDFSESNLKQKTNALLQRNLKSRIINLLHHHDIIFDQNWVTDFVKKRNDAAHGAYIHEKDDFLKWTRMAALLEKIILKQLNYTGEYIDWSESPPQQKSF